MAKWIDISTSQHQLKLFDGTRLIKTYPLQLEKYCHQHLLGHTRLSINNSIHGGPFGVLWMGLSKPHYGIHGTNNPASIGKNVSHGCIRMFNHDVLDLSSRVPIGTRVAIHK